MTEIQQDVLIFPLTTPHVSLFGFLSVILKNINIYFSLIFVKQLFMLILAHNVLLSNQTGHET